MCLLLTAVSGQSGITEGDYSLVEENIHADYGCVQKTKQNKKNPRVCVCLRIPGYAGPYFLVEPGTLWPQWLDLTGR